MNGSIRLPHLLPLMLACFVALVTPLAGAAEQTTAVQVDFSRALQSWDGFGVNYVEASQTRDYAADPQDYGAFSTLSEEKRQQILAMIFGAGGLKPALLKMFLDPFHEGLSKSGNDNSDPSVIALRRYDHTTTTRWMRYFAREGLARTRVRGGDLTFVVTLYGPPAWMTRQGFIRGRDLDAAEKHECAEYMISWAKYLRTVEKLPVKYISLHNEGEDFSRWPTDGSSDGGANHDYNMYWPSAQVVDFLKFMRGMLDEQGMQDVGLTPGETTNWYRFAMWGYATAIAVDPEAMKNLGLITSHGFTGRGRWYGIHTSIGNDLLRMANPRLHAWTTSTTWGKTDAHFVDDIRRQIYEVKVNGVIPWAVIQSERKWVGGDPNPGTAFRVDGHGNFRVEPGYYFYKQVTRAGQPGMAVASVSSPHPDIQLIAFSRNRTANHNAFIVLNLSDSEHDVSVEVRGSESGNFSAHRTSRTEQYASLGELKVRDGIITCSAPGKSVTTFFEKE